MMANLSAAIEKSPNAFTAVTFGNGGTVKCFPGGYAYRGNIGELLPEMRDEIHT